MLSRGVGLSREWDGGWDDGRTPMRSRPSQALHTVGLRGLDRSIDRLHPFALTSGFFRSASFTKRRPHIARIERNL